MTEKKEKEADLADFLKELAKRKKLPEVVAGVQKANESEKFPEGERAKEEKLPPEKVEIKKE
jgi:hypothetical protein